MSTYSSRQKQNIILVILIALGLFIAFALLEIFASFLGAIVLYVLLKPFYIFLTEKKGFNRTLVIIVIILGTLLILVLPFFSLTLLLIQKITAIAENPEELLKAFQKITTRLSATFSIQKMDLSALISDLSKSTLKLFPSLINGAADVLLSLMIMYFLLFFMFRDHDKFEETLIKYLPFSYKDNHLLLDDLKNITFSNVLGQGLIALIQGGLIALGGMIFRIPDPLFWGMIAFFLSFLPVVGTPVVFVPLGLYMLSEGNTYSGVGILLWGFVLVINIDNIIRLIMARKLGDVHPLIMIIGLVIGLPYFGILGLVFGPLLISYFILLVRIYRESRKHSGS
jgi:predicted PurR-regulated permease PerM